MSTRAALNLRDVTASDRAERALLGTLLVSPALFAAARSLRPEDFRSAPRGEVFAAICALEAREPGSWDAVVLAHELERSGAEPPPGLGWFAAVSSLLDDCAPGDETVPGYVRLIREAAVMRRAARWSA